MKIIKVFLVTALLLLTGSVNAAIIQVTGTSAASGELGSFIVDEAVIAADADGWLYASQFEDFYFADPLGSEIFDLTTVIADTGRTIFSFIAGEWTVTGGSGDSLTNTSGAGVWIAGTSYLSFSGTGHDFSDVSWSTAVYEGSVPLPAPLALLGIGALALGIARRKIKLA